LRNAALRLAAGLAGNSRAAVPRAVSSGTIAAPSQSSAPSTSSDESPKKCTARRASAPPIAAPTRPPALIATYSRLASATVNSSDKSSQNCAIATVAITASQT
jgi:hypothetical protein